MESLGGENMGERVPMRTVAAASFAGAFLEWYDFFIYGTAAALVFNQLFFTESAPSVGILLAFATYGVGFAARPLGGVIFGHYGDKLGRKAMLIVTIIIMGVATFLIGCLPTYSQVGVWAPILLVALRIFQGIGLGGEYGGAALMVIEHAPRDRRGFWASFPQAAASAGILLATGVFAVVSSLPEEQLFAWGWRIPFLLSALLLIVGLFIRLRITETPAFQEVKDTGTEASIPLFELFSRYPKNILLTLGARLGETVSSNLFNAFAISYLATQLGQDSSVALTGILIASAIGLFVVPALGALSDRIGRRPIYLFGAVFVALWAFPFFLLLNTETAVLIYVATILGYVLGPSSMFSVQSVFFAELYGTRVRYSGLSIAYQVSAIAGGFSPLVAATLLLPLDGAPWIVAGVLCAIAVISAVCTYLATETYQSDVSETEGRPAATDSPVTDSST